MFTTLDMHNRTIIMVSTTKENTREITKKLQKLYPKNDIGHEDLENKKSKNRKPKNGTSKNGTSKNGTSKNRKPKKKEDPMFYIYAENKIALQIRVLISKITPPTMTIEQMEDVLVEIPIQELKTMKYLLERK